MTAALAITEQDVDAWHTQMCQALRFGRMVQEFPSMVGRCLAYETWRRRYCRDLGRPFRGPLEYFTYNEPDGVGTTAKQVERLLVGSDVEDRWREATKRPGARNDLGHNITEVKMKGTSRAYTLARLERDHPALAACVRAGELSANKAAIEAGFRKKPTPFQQVKKLITKLTDEEWRPGTRAKHASH